MQYRWIWNTYNERRLKVQIDTRTKSTTKTKQSETTMGSGTNCKIVSECVGCEWTYEYVYLGVLVSIIRTTVLEK